MAFLPSRLHHLLFQEFTSESIFGDLPAPPTEPSERIANSSDPLNFDPFGLNDPLPKQEPLLAPQLLQEEGMDSMLNCFLKIFLR